MVRNLDQVKLGVVVDRLEQFVMALFTVDVTINVLVGLLNSTIIEHLSCLFYQFLLAELPLQLLFFDFSQLVEGL